MRIHPGFLGHDDSIDIQNRIKSGLVHQLQNSLEQQTGIGIFEGLVRRRELLADIRQPGRSKERVGNRVQQHIGIRVTVKTPIVRDLHSADNQTSSGHQPVHVKTMSCPQLSHASRPPAAPRP